MSSARKRRAVATFEEPVKKLAGDWGSIELFWPRVFLAEHKSEGKDPGKAHAQGMEYIRGLQDSGRGDETPRFQRLPPASSSPLRISPAPAPVWNSSSPSTKSSTLSSQ